MFGLQAQFNFQLFQSYYVKGCLHKHNIAWVIQDRQEWRRLPSTVQKGRKWFNRLRATKKSASCSTPRGPFPELSEYWWLGFVLFSLQLLNQK